MRRPGTFEDTALPSHWPTFVKWAILETISLAHRAITYSRSYAINSSIERVRLQAHSNAESETDSGSGRQRGREDALGHP